MSGLDAASVGSGPPASRCRRSRRSRRAPAGSRRLHVRDARDDGPGLSGLDWYVEELLDGRCREPYVLTGHDGTGFNSWAIHYHLVHGGLAVFDQIAWGGAYTDDELAVSVMAAHWTQIGDLIAAVDAEVQDSRAVAPRCVVVLRTSARRAGGEGA